MVARQVVAVADHHRAQCAAKPGAGRCQGIDEDVGSLEVPHHADVKQIRRIGSDDDRFEFGGAQSVVDQRVRDRRLAHLSAIGPPLIVRDEQQAIGEARHGALKREEQLPGGCRFVIVERAAMRRIKAGYARP